MEHKKLFFDKSRRGAFLAVLLVLSAGVLSAQQELPGDWLRFSLRGSSFGPLFEASSVLEPGEGIYLSRYDSDKAMDRDRNTAWVEGVPGPGHGESYWLGLEHYPEALGLINGYAKNRELFEKNYRLRRVKVQLFAGVNLSGFAGQWHDYYDALPISSARTLELSDSMEAQRIELPFDISTVVPRMEEF
ncbi:MAG TPA: hypothetical protein ENN41_05680 [Sediminispirochaeta sp.]|nr:hypothetical protein [Sediminispirochaeta sp.]